jgi:hypothetical protein
MAPGAAKKKRGAACAFVGKHFEFLMGNVPLYVKKSKAKKTPEMWGPLFVDYWEAFPWRLPFDQDAVVGVNYSQAPVDDEEKKRKRENKAFIENVSCDKFVDALSLTKI